MGLTYSLISQAIKGDQEALDLLILHYGNYIDAVINSNGNLFIGTPANSREEIRAIVLEQLLLAIPKFKEQI